MFHICAQLMGCVWATGMVWQCYCVSGATAKALAVAPGSRYVWYCYSFNAHALFICLMHTSPSG